jgi:Flp pilus assembly protein TadG
MRVDCGKLWPGSRQGSADAKNAKGLTSVLGRFSRDTRGDVAIVFGLMALALFMMIGLAVDYARFLSARNQTLAATDAAVLAAARALQTNSGDQQAALTLAKTYYDQAIQSRLHVINDGIGFAIGDNATSVIATGNAAISTPFMGLGGTKTLPLLHSDGSDYSKAVLAVGGNAETNLEISMMLDVSGSMGEGTKLDDMKDAANDLVDIVVWADQSKYTSRVAIVPFSSDVLPTSDLFKAATGQNATPKPSPVVYTVTSGSGKKKKTTDYDYPATTCVAERPGKDYSDTAPGSNHYVLREFTSSGRCGINSAGELLPMTSDKSDLHDKINGLVDGGNTGGHIGTAWTYYMLSPKWASALPSGSKPVAYGTANTNKIAILMTDGEYNSVHDSKGVETGQTGAGSSVNGTDSPTQAKAVCSDMKKNGIEVYTVGFQLGGNQTAISTLSNCATDTAHFYNSTTGDALKAAFRDIALKISTLYLAQ